MKPHSTMLASIITKVTTMADNTIRLQVDCQEMTPEQTAEIFRLKGGMGYFLFAENPKAIEDIADLPEIHLEKWEKSPSQRLRSVLFVYWEGLRKKGKTNTPFEAWYRDEIEKIITYIKEKLDQTSV